MAEIKYGHAAMLDHFQTGIFAAMDIKKQELMKKGVKVYNLSVGTPDFRPPEHIMKAVEEAVKDPLNYRYTLVDSQEMLDAVVSSMSFR